MTMKQDDGLFLLEVLIDKINFTKSPCFTDRDFRTCVMIKCPSVDPMEICEDDSAPGVAKGGGPFTKMFNSGKSCLFSLKEDEIARAMSNFSVNVQVFKSLPCGCLPTKIVMGVAKIDMTKEFIQARQNFLANPENVSYEALKDSFHIVGAEKEETGSIDMFLRISCFGKLIVTKFQGATGPPVLGGSNTAGPSYLDRSCDPQRSFQTNDDPCVCGVARNAAGVPPGGQPCSAPCVSGGRGGGGKQSGICPPGDDHYNKMPCEDPEDPCYCCGGKSKKQTQMLCRNTHQYCQHIPKGPSNQYEEIGTNLTGNELKIKVPANACVIKKISQTHLAMQSPFVKKGKEGPCDPPCGKNQISLALPSEATCCHGPRPQGTQFTCTTEGCSQSTKHGQQDGAQGDDDHDLPINKDVFVLKVAKTAMQGDRRCTLELELVAPKGPDKDPPIRKQNIRVSTEPDCCMCAAPRLATQSKQKKKR